MNEPDLRIMTYGRHREDVVFCLHYLKKKKSITTGAGLNLIMINAFELRVINELWYDAKCVVCLLPPQIMFHCH